MSAFRATSRLVACGLSLLGPSADLACSSRDETPAPVGAFPKRIAVRLDGPEVEASLDGDKFVPWPAVAARLAAFNGEGADAVVRLRATKSTVQELLEALEILRRVLGQPMTIEYSTTGGDMVDAEIHVTESWTPLLSDDELGCAQIEAVDDGFRVVIRSRDTATRLSRLPTPALRSAAHARLVMATTHIWNPELETERTDNSLSCEGLISSEQCDRVLSQSLGNIFSIGIPCRKAFIYAEPQIEWPRLSMLFGAMSELGADIVFVGARE